MIAALTGVRAFAALWVVFFHLRIGPARAIALPEWIDALCRLGYLGVDLFGLLSGFVIAHNYAERLAHRNAATVGRYLWIRAVRIVPLHWFALAILVAARVGLDGFDARFDAFYRGGDLLEQAALVHGFGIGHLAWNQPSWTVSSEWLCYLLFPLVATWIARSRAANHAALLAAATLLATIAAMHTVGHADFDAAANWGWLRIGGEFLTGCWLQRAYAAGFARRAPWAAIGPAAVVAAGIAVALGCAGALVVCFAVLVYALAQQRGALDRVLAARPIVFLGEASYAIYMLHYVVLRLFVHWVPSADAAEAASLARAGLCLAVILSAAIAAHLVIENPARRRLRTWVTPV